MIDTESTGLGSDAEVVSIAVIDRNSSPVYSTLVRPSGAIPAAASAIHGLYDVDVADAPKFAEIYPDLVSAMSDSYLLAYNAGYDASLLERECQRYDLPALHTCGVIWSDIMLPYSAWIGERDYTHEDYRWQPLPHKDGEPHSAERDCEIALELLKTMADAGPE